jgi:hypothetical protein
MSTEPDQSGRLTALGQLEGFETASVRDRRDEVQKKDLMAALKVIKDGKMMSKREALLMHRELAEAGLVDTPTSTSASGDDMHGGGLGLETNAGSSYADGEAPPSPSDESSTPSHIRTQFPFFDWRMGPNGYRFPSSIYDEVDGDETPDSSSSQDSVDSDDEEVQTAELDRHQERTSHVSQPVSAVSESAKDDEGPTAVVEGRPSTDTL